MPEANILLQKPDKEFLITPEPPPKTKEKKPLFSCDWCGKGLQDKKSLSRHISQHNKDAKFQCEKCGKIYSKKYKLSDHLLKHLGKFRSKCEHCGKGFMRQYSLKVYFFNTF